MPLLSKPRQIFEAPDTDSAMDPLPTSFTLDSVAAVVSEPANKRDLMHLTADSAAPIDAIDLIADSLAMSKAVHALVTDAVQRVIFRYELHDHAVELQV